MEEDIISFEKRCKREEYDIHRKMTGLSHIVPIIKADDGIMDLVYFKKGDLFEYFDAQSEKIDHKSIKDIVRCVVIALYHCRKMNVVHMDVKMENIMIGEGGLTDLYLGDFGLSISVDEDMEFKFSPAGTMLYVAPEVISNAEVKYPEMFKCDYWSLGVICYILKTKRAPFAYNNDMGEYLIGISKKIHIIHNIAKRWGSFGDFVIRLLQIDYKKRMNIEEAIEHAFLKN